MTYQCPVEPGKCPQSTRLGFCSVHTTVRLSPVRQLLGSAERSPAAAEPAGAGTSIAQPAPADPATASATAQPQVGLVILGQTVVVPPEGLVLGRDAPGIRDLPGMANLRQVGRRHARLSWRDGALHITDLQSLNGTFLDGQRVSDPQPLRPGQMLRLARDVEVAVIELDEYGFPR